MSQEGLLISFEEKQRIQLGNIEHIWSRPNLVGPKYEGTVPSSRVYCSICIYRSDAPILFTTLHRTDSNTLNKYLNKMLEIFKDPLQIASKLI